MIRQALATGFLVASVLVAPGALAMQSAGASAVASAATTTGDQSVCKTGTRCAKKRAHHKRKHALRHRRHRHHVHH